VLLRIRAAPASADELVRAVELDAAAVAAALTELELYGLLTETRAIHVTAGPETSHFCGSER
jgi:predicted Rossmann fold nucleotide-binding protein DprA/Smf involved in DNA uptake